MVKYVTDYFGWKIQIHHQNSTTQMSEKRQTVIELHVISPLADVM